MYPHSFSAHRSRHTFPAAIIAAALIGPVITPLSFASAAEVKPQVLAAAAAEAPGSLVNAGELAENLYDAGHDKDWPAATTKLAALHSVISQATKELGLMTEEQRKAIRQLNSQLDAVTQAVTKRQQHETTRIANQMTLGIAELAGSFHLKIPVDVTRLDYLGRELEIWEAVADESKLKATADQIEVTWRKLQPDIVAHGGRKEARSFGTLVDKLKGARSVADYAAVTKPILDEVDNLEQVYNSSVTR